MTVNLFRGETRVRLNKIVASCVPEVIVKSIPRGHDRKGGRFHERSSRAVVVPFHFDSILATSFSKSWMEQRAKKGERGKGGRREGIGETRALTNSPRRVSWVVVMRLPRDSSRFARNSTRERCWRIDRIISTYGQPSVFRTTFYDVLRRKDDPRPLISWSRDRFTIGFYQKSKFRDRSYE